jgi:hypothetical protein
MFNAPQYGLDGMALLKSVTNDTVASHGYDLLTDRWDVLSASPEYLALNMSQVSRQSLDFLEMRNGTAAAYAADRRLLDYLAERMETQDLDQYFLLGGQDPAGFNQLFETLGRSAGNGDLMVFFGEAYDALTGN